MGKKIMVAPLGVNMDALFVGIREFPTEKVILVAAEQEKESAGKVKQDLEKFRIPASIERIHGNLWEEVFRILGEITKAESPGNIIINVATGDQMTGCALTSAAFVNGLKAIGVQNNEVILLPVLKFSYYKILTDKKMEILRFIYDDTQCCSSLEELSKKTGMSLPLISYHVNGNLKSEGLKDLGLVETTENTGKTSIALTTMGRMLIKGYL